MSTPGEAEPAAEDPSADELAPKRRGRRRDVEVDRRIIDVARAVYAERGWAGFNFDVIAHQAQVSKDAIYRRYASKIDLLLATITREDDKHVPAVPDGDIRAFLLAAAHQYFANYLSGTGVNSLRIFVEAPLNPELVDAFHRERAAPVIVRTRAAIRTAIDAGLLPDATSPTAVLDAVLGGILLHVLATPPELRTRMMAGADAYLTEIVDLVLRGCGYDFGPR